MIRLRNRIESARRVPVLGVAVTLLLVLVFLAAALELHEHSALELLAIGHLAVVAMAAVWLLCMAVRQNQSAKKFWLRGAIVGRAPPADSISPVLGSFVPGASPSLR
jgi:hypothetical protein